MLIFLLKYLTILDFSSYVFIRSFIALFVSFFIILISMKKTIFLLNKFKIKQVVRVLGPKTHFNKNKIPTMGGILIIFSVVISIILCANLSNIYIFYFFFIFLGYGFIGFIDDFLKIKNKNSTGLKMKWKYFFQSLLALLVAFLLFNADNENIIFYFLKNLKIKLNFLYIFIVYFIIVGTSNAVNLTDGLDGLVIIPIVLVSFFLSFLSFISSDFIFSAYFNMQYIKEVDELAVICFSIIGASLGFLWFNSYPSQIFMGDTGSMSIGGSLGLIAVLLKQEFLFSIVSGIFIIETFSVVLQILFFKIFKIRIFNMAPIHHHYELNKIPESKIIIRFWIVSFIFTLIGLMVLKVF